MDNKPLETDDQEESLEDLFEETLDETPQEPGSEDVGGTSFKEKLEELSGRTFKDEADAIKHYENLKSFVGKRQEPKAKAEVPDVLEKLTSLEQKMAERDFVQEIPDAKEHLELIRSVSKADSLPLNEAWNKVKDYVGAFETSKKEKTIVDSKNRPNTPQTKEFQALADKARSEGLTLNEQAELLKKAGVV
jgi:hypothetical protein